ncbi:hypothetical protein [Geomonas sp.]|uniref:hypothetical protein n=1 Tax=Geomonas sp. TaxID=2651584 RepID=UPI002B45A0EF|nr:hypothetical protein [Geomonas sp.]HJV36702.1 hypothetical protein [Geomonas sp.]
MSAVYLAMVVAGLALVVWGLPAAHRLKKPLDILAALAVLVGVVVALLGALLVAVPGFFKG